MEKNLNAIDKAKELVFKFKNTDEAILCVEEIIKSWKTDGNIRIDFGVIAYWEMVVFHIKKEEKKEITFTIDGYNLTKILTNTSKRKGGSF